MPSRTIRGVGAVRSALGGSGPRYLLSSAGTWAVDLGVFLLLYRALPVPLALLVSRLAAMGFGFVAHKFFSFQRRTRPSTREMVGYAALAILNFAIVATALSAFAGRGELFIAALKLSLEIVLFVINYFLLRRLFVGPS